jgi:hypothetical protein
LDNLLGVSFADQEQDFSNTNPCTGAPLGLTYFPPLGEEPDGTIDQGATAVGSYLDGPAQQRYQSDASSKFTDGMVGCYAPGTSNLAGIPTGLCDQTLVQLVGHTLDTEVPGQDFIGTGDGTQTLTLDWTAPTTTFATYHAALGGVGAFATYATGNAADAPDTFKLNFYNQLAAPIATFSVLPNSSVETSTAVTVTGTVLDQFQNAIVDAGVQFVRSGGNDVSCTPIQNSSNSTETTNQAGVAGYTFSCDAPGVSNVSIVVLGPGGTQLATGREAVTFNGIAVKVVKELPTIKVSSPSAGHLVVHVTTHPAVAGKRINIYRKLNGLYHLIGSVKTGPHGKATKHIAGLHRGVKYNIAAKAVGLGAGYHSKYSVHKSVTIKE